MCDDVFDAVGAIDREDPNYESEEVSFADTLNHNVLQVHADVDAPKSDRRSAFSYVRLKQLKSTLSP